MGQHINVPRIVIGAPQGRSGKTTVTLGLISALLRRGSTVQAFKKGPDFIDPSWMGRLTGRPCRNLDTFLMEHDAIKSSFAQNSANADVAIVEGAMGLFDGVDVVGSGSTAEIAKIIKSPVILVINTTRMTRSVAAMVRGFAEFDENVHIGGVILNKVARPRHENILRASIEKYCNVPVIGAIPKGEEFSIPDRHLGLVPADENEELFLSIGKIGEAVERYVDLDKLLDVAREAQSLEFHPTGGDAGEKCKVKIGVIHDAAFSFYYPENLEALTELGAELVYLNALEDAGLPNLDGLYIGGGFPEIFADRLEQNRSFRDSLRRKIEDGLPVYAEGGGLLYLGRKISWQGKEYEMAGALPLDAEMLAKPQGHGYIVVKVTEKNPFVRCGTTVKAHEFHHARIVNLDRGRVRIAYEVTRGTGMDGESDGILYRNVLASFSHIHARSVVDWAANMVKSAGEHSKRQGGEV